MPIDSLYLYLKAGGIRSFRRKKGMAARASAAASPYGCQRQVLRNPPLRLSGGSWRSLRSVAPEATAPTRPPDR